MSKVSYVGPSAASLLGVAFVILKLTGVIAWPWIWVLAPFWIPVVIFIVLLIIILIAVIILNKRYEF